MFETSSQRLTPVWITVLLIRLGWWKYRKELGYPISLRRAFFDQCPRFGSFEADEEGCPQYIKDEYESVKNIKEDE